MKICHNTTWYRTINLKHFPVLVIKLIKVLRIFLHK